MARRLAISKRFSLAEIDTAWKDCYIEYSPATIHDLTKFQELNPQGQTETQAIDYMVTFIKDHTLRGKVLLVNDDGTPGIADLVKEEDIDNLPPNVIKTLFADMNGAILDPKDTPQVAPVAAEQPASVESTVTPSSTGQ